MKKIICFLNQTLGEIKKAIKNLYKWNKPKSIGMSLITAPSVDYLVREPYGTVDINGKIY